MSRFFQSLGRNVCVGWNPSFRVIDRMGQRQMADRDHDDENADHVRHRVEDRIVGVFVGILAAIMGVGGGFIMVPAMIYLLGMPTKVVVGTSLFQIIFVTAFTTLLHATTNFTVDVVLAVLLLIGGVVGAQVGARLGANLKAEQLRILLAIMVLAVCGKLALDLLLMPSELYSLGDSGGH